MRPDRRVSVRRRLLAIGAGLGILAAGPGLASSTFSAFVGTTANSGNSFSATYWVPPTVGGSVIVSLLGGSPLPTPGWIHQGGSYEVLANVTEPNAGVTVASVTADASQITSGDTAVTLAYSSTGVTLAGTTYHYLSAALTANSTLSGTKPHTVTAIDTYGNSSGAVSFPGSASVDNTAPAAPSISAIANYIAGTVSVGGTTGSDSGGSGVAGELIQISPSKAGTWSTACLATGSGAVTCPFNTATETDGAYDFRGETVDNAGNTSNASGMQSSKTIDNTPPTVTALSIIPSIGNLKDSVTLSATGSDSSSGMQEVDYQVSPAGAGTWTTLCSKSGAGGSVICSLDNTAVFPTDNANYDFRALAVDKVGNTMASATVTRYVDNSPFATNIQAVNGAGTANVPGAGDVITYSYSEPLSPNSVDAGGWTGAAKTVSVRLYQNGSDDYVVVYDGLWLLNLGTAHTNGDYVVGGANNTAYVAFSSSTITQSGSNLTVTLGGTPTYVGGATGVQAGGSGRMTLAASSAATDASGQVALSTITATQSGSALDF
jgi:hypothetical protein